MALKNRIKQVMFKDEEFNVQLFLHACDRNDITLIKKYINQGVDPNCHTGDHMTCLHIAAERDYCNLIHILLKIPNININARSLTGATPLFQACRRDNINAALILISNNADVNLPNNMGTTPLHNSALLRYSDVARVLLENNAIVDYENVFGKTPLYHAVLDSPNELIMTLLVENGATVNFRNVQTLPILLEGALNCQTIDEVKILMHFIELGADVNITDILTGRTALHMVAISNFVPLADILISNGANIYIKDYNHRTPLDIAIRHENKDMIDFLKFVIKLERSNASSRSSFSPTGSHSSHSGSHTEFLTSSHSDSQTGSRTRSHTSSQSDYHTGSSTTPRTGSLYDSQAGSQVDFQTDSQTDSRTTPRTSTQSDSQTGSRTRPCTGSQSDSKATHSVSFTPNKKN